VIVAAVALCWGSAAFGVERSGWPPGGHHFGAPGRAGRGGARRPLPRLDQRSGEHPARRRAGLPPARVRSCRSWRAASYRAVQRCQPGPARCGAIPAAASSSTTYRHPAQPSSAKCNRSARRTWPASPQMHSVSGNYPSPLHLPRHGVQIVERQLPSMHVKRAYGTHERPLKRWDSSSCYRPG
jgi:hypothetical protein